MIDYDVGSPTTAPDRRDARIKFPFDSANCEPGDDKSWVTLQSR